MTAAAPIETGSAGPSPANRGADGSATKSAIALALMKVFPQVSSLVLFVIIARFLTTSQFGAYSLSTVIISILNQLCWVGFFEFCLKRQADRETLDTVFVAGSVWSFILGLGAWIAAPFLSTVFHVPEMRELIRALSFTTFTTLVSVVLVATLYTANRYTAAAFASFTAEAAGFAAAVGALFGGLGVWALVVQRCVQTVVSVGVMMVQTRWQPTFRFKPKIARELGVFASALGADHFIGFLATYGSDLMLGIFVSPAAAGVYRFGARIVAAVVSLLVEGCRPLIWVMVSRLPMEQPIGPTFLKTQSTAAFVMVACLGGLAAVAQPLVEVITKPEWSEAALVIVAQCIVYALIVPMSVALEPSLGVRGFVRTLPAMRLVQAATFLAAIAVSARFGIVPVAFALIAPAVFQTFIFATVARWRLGVPRRELLLNNIPIVLNVLMMAAAVYLVRTLAPATAPALVRLGLEVSAGGLVYIACAYAFTREHALMFQGMALSLLRVKRRGAA